MALVVVKMTTIKKWQVVKTATCQKSVQTVVKCQNGTLSNRVYRKFPKWELETEMDIKIKLPF